MSKRGAGETRERELREAYSTGFRNVNTLIGFNNYNDKGENVGKIRGFLSGSKLLYTGESFTGKTTLACNMISNAMRPFVREKNENVLLHIIDTESGANDSRFRHLSKFTDEELARHVIYHTNTSLDELKLVIENDILNKREKDYKMRKTVNSKGEEIEIYHPTFILVDAISELVSNDALEIGSKDHKAFSAKKGLDMHIFWQKYTSYFAKYNINLFMVSHIADNIEMNAGPPGMPPARKLAGISGNKKISGGKNTLYQTDIAFYLEKFIIHSDKSAETKSATWLGSEHVVQAKLIKNRQSKPNIPFSLVLDMEYGYNPMTSFLYDCVLDNVIQTVGGFKQLEGWEKKFRSAEIVDLFTTNSEFRKLLFENYEKSKSDILDAMYRDEEQTKRVNDILDFMNE